MTSRERFEAWFEKEYGFKPGHTRSVSDNADAAASWFGWQARDAEVRELVEAAKAIVAWYERDGSVGGIVDPIEELNRVLAKHESEGGGE